MQVEIRQYSDIGHYLSEARESLQMDIRDAATSLNIRAKYLVALEQGDLAVMPGKIYARGYLQTYAEFLGLDKDEVMEAFDRVDPEKKETRYFTPEPTSSNYQPGTILVGIALVAVFLIYFYWYSTHKSALVEAPYEVVAPVPERLINPLADVQNKDNDASAGVAATEEEPATPLDKTAPVKPEDAAVKTEGEAVAPAADAEKPATPAEALKAPDEKLPETAVGQTAPAPVESKKPFDKLPWLKKSDQ